LFPFAARRVNDRFPYPGNSTRTPSKALSQEHIEAGAMILEFLRPPTLAALRVRLKDTKRPVHILHFDGHGIFEGELDRNGLRKQGGEQGKLAFEQADGTLDRGYSAN
jgi:hypothetical protein